MRYRHQVQIATMTKAHKLQRASFITDCGFARMPDVLMVPDSRKRPSIGSREATAEGSWIWLPLESNPYFSWNRLAIFELNFQRYLFAISELMNQRSKRDEQFPILSL